MKTPFKKLRGLGLHRHNTHRPPAQLDELSQASQDMHDMKDCYDSLLSAAAATANSAYEFSESLRDMGDCLLEKTSLNDDEDSGRVLLMLGKVQFEIQKLVDNYRAHISRTITAPSESLLSELRVVEDMKRQCDEKRMTYDEMKIRHKDKRKSGGGEYVSSHQLRAAQEEFDEDATLFVFRMKSLKKGQSRSLLTQAARHHAAQMCFFRKSLRSLEAIEPHVMLVTQQQHIDYQFSGLEEDDDDDDRNSVFLTDDDTEDDSEVDMHQDGELSFEYQRGDPKNEASSSENSMELDSAADITFPQVAVKANMEEQRKPLWNSSTFGVEVNAGSKCKSAPLSASAASSNMNMERDPRQMRQSSARKLNTYVLPTPTPQKTNNNKNNLWHSSPLVSSSSSGPIHPSNAQSVLSKPTPLPSPTASQIEHHPSVSAKKIKRYAFSGPLAGSSSSSRNKAPLSATVSGPIPITRTPLASTTKLSGGNTNSNSFVSSPKISELHELPRPPANLASIKVKPPLKPAFSAPLVTITNKPLGLHASSQRMLSPSPPQTPVSISIRNS